MDPILNHRQSRRHKQRRRTELDRRRKRRRASVDVKGPAQTPRRPLRNRQWRRLSALKAKRGPEAKYLRRVEVVKLNASRARLRAVQAARIDVARQVLGAMVDRPPREQARFDDAEAKRERRRAKRRACAT